MGRRRVRQGGQLFHRQLDALNRRRGDALDLGRRNPARVDLAAFALVVQHGPRRDAVADSELADIAVLQVGNALVPVVGVEAAQVRPRYERLLAVHFQGGLENKAASRSSSGASLRRLTRNSDTERVPLGTRPSKAAMSRMGRTDRATFRPSLSCTSHSAGFCDAGSFSANSSTRSLRFQPAGRRGRRAGPDVLRFPAVRTAWVAAPRRGGRVVDNRPSEW